MTVLTPHEAQVIALSYQKDPSNVICPRCGPEFVEVVEFVNKREQMIVPPEGEYSVLLFCVGCGAKIVIDLSPEVHSGTPSGS